MADILVRDMPASTLVKLKKRAKQNGRSLQSEVQLLIQDFIQRDEGFDPSVATKIKKSFRGRQFSDSGSQLRKDRSR